MLYKKYNSYLYGCCYTADKLFLWGGGYCSTAMGEWVTAIYIYTGDKLFVELGYSYLKGGCGYCYTGWGNCYWGGGQLLGM